MTASMSIIEAINEIVETIGEFPMSTGGTVPTGTGTSIYDRARQFLDRESKFVQSWGWPENTVIAKKYVASEGSAGSKKTPELTNAAIILTLRASGGSAHRNLVARQDADDSNKLKIYDGNNGTFIFRDDEELFVDQVEALKGYTAGPTNASAWGFEIATVPLQQAIVDQAKIKFQRRYQGSMESEAGLVQEAAVSDIRVQRNQVDTTQPLNVQPLIPGGRREQEG